MQPALDRPQAAAPAAAPQGLAPPVGSPEWAPALGHQMLRMRAGGQQVAELSLNPAGLGPLKITLGVGDNQVQAMFVSAHESVRKAVEAALPQLRSTLAEQGISLGQTSVGADARPWAGMGGFAQQQEQQRQASSGAASAWPAAARGAEVPAATPSTRTASPPRTSGVDTFA
jgi:flagellar hook-length control protein FliK